jgi:hypothetical protein
MYLVGHFLAASLDAASPGADTFSNELLQLSCLIYKQRKPVDEGEEC